MVLLSFAKENQAKRSKRKGNKAKLTENGLPGGAGGGAGGDGSQISAYSRTWIRYELDYSVPVVYR